MSVDITTQFNEVARNVLDKLISACPLQVEITAETQRLRKGQFVERPSSHGIMGTTGFYKKSQDEEILESTLVWLTAEGFIRAGKTRDHYVATLQTLKLDGSVPSALRGVE